MADFDTSNVTDMTLMFNGCEALESINVDGFNTSKVTGIAGMFRNNPKLQYIDLSSFSLDSIDDVDHMNTNAVFSTKTGEDLPTVIITKDAIIKQLEHNGRLENARIGYEATVTFDANGGQFATRSAKENTVTLGGQIFYDTVEDYQNEFQVTQERLETMVNNPQNGNKRFVGWYLDRNGDKKFEHENMTLGNTQHITVYAKWEETHSNQKPTISNQKPTIKGDTDKNGGLNNSVLVKTGDESSILQNLMIGGIAAAILVTVFKLKTKKNKTN